jgi:hypothetical protein
LGVDIEEERLPFEEGFTRPEGLVSTLEILARQAALAVASIGAWAEKHGGRFCA